MIPNTQNNSQPKAKINISKMIKVPYLSIPDTPIIGFSQNFMPIADITEDILILKDGGAALVLESTSLNFGLLSEKEQQAVIAAYAALLNSLSFSLQILVRSQLKDISNYIDYLNKAEAKITNPKLLVLVNDYKKFVQETIKKKNVLGKNFYIIIPFTPYELGVTKSAASVTKRSGPLPFPKSYVIKKAKIALYPKRDHLIRQASRLGLKLRQLSTPQLVELMFNIFNPEEVVEEKEEKK